MSICVCANPGCSCCSRAHAASLCRREGIAQNLYYRWSKDFLEAGKKRRGTGRVTGQAR
jgi:transposase-like protein